jgi:toxin ParE1/3/4
MSTYVLGPRAREDIEEIWDYTADNWDMEQADRYVGGLQQAIESVARNPNRGRPCDDVRRGYRRYAVGSHMLFFRLHEQGIEVVRIRHQSMDFDLHL